jgi:hypothetical protein
MALSHKDVCKAGYFVIGDKTISGDGRTSPQNPAMLPANCKQGIPYKMYTPPLWSSVKYDTITKQIKLPTQIPLRN